ncbi:amino acid adenylation domain-containing protein [Lentzea sp. NPDC051838]|uniref:non-ribosomal peptide synthetase n=1 Tax=Lentzea sp. NPDC051838 TaxID=3154849 RepID=UPI0034387FCA
MSLDPIVDEFLVNAPDVAALEQALTAEASKRVELRAYFRELDGTPVRLVARRIAVRINDDSPLDPANPPLFRVSVADGVLRVVIHPLLDCHPLPGAEVQPGGTGRATAWVELEGVTEDVVAALGGLLVEGEPSTVDFAGHVLTRVVPVVEADEPVVRVQGGQVRVEHADAERWLARLQSLVTTGELLPPSERDQLRAWSTGPRTPAQPPVHELVEAAARDHPDAVAVRCQDEVLTFRELDERANRLANALRARGVRVEDRVAVCLNRGLDLPVALLGVLKAGAAYLPLDPANPPGRLAFLVADGGARQLVTSPDLASRVPVLPRRRLLLDGLDSYPTTKPEVEVHQDNLAYVLHTSGSTGVPKGVGVTHGGFANYASWAQKAYELEKGSGSPLHSSIGFDLTVTSLFPALAAGRTVTLTDADVTGLAKVLSDGGQSLVKLTPAHLDLLGALLAPEELARATRRLVVGGEALSGQTLSAWTEHAPETLVVNEYGPTETVVGCCVHEVAAGAAPPGPVPIGRPIDNTTLHVLDEHLRPVPIGARGELFIGGAGVARGYLGRPGLTAERFVPDPAAPGERLYRTGDEVRYREDGVLEYLGRADDQVKVRGHRIEPGEIEMTLVRHPGVSAVAVIAREDVPGDRRLVAYYVPAGEPPDDLADFLRRTLPDYMVPAHYVELPELPLTRNGKVDRAALPAPGVKTELERDAVLDEDITPVGLPSANVLHPRHILLTGATGYLGAFLLAELLQTNTVHCLVRSDDDQAARQRVETCLRDYQLWHDDFRDRIEVVRGSLDQPRLGLDDDTYARLALQIDVIYHCGALVNFVFPYAALRQPNVLGTKEILRLACTTKAKAVHHMSTLDVLMHGSDKDVREDTVIPPSEVVGGYDQSKWVAEQLVAAAGKRGLPVVRYRPGAMLGHSGTGVANPSDYSCVLVKGCVQLGIGPDHDLSLNFMPVDHVSRAVAHLSRQQDSFGRVFHLNNPTPLPLADVWRWITDYGYEFEIVDDTRWRAALAGVGPENALFPVVPLLLREDFVDPRAGGEYRVDRTNTETALAGTGLTCPPLDAAHGRRVLDHLVRTGFLPPVVRGMCAAAPAFRDTARIRLE